MPYLSITPEEATILRELLKTALSDLDREIWHTDAREFKQGLQERKQALERVLKGIGDHEPRLAGMP
jgi:hypothetical protein